jgi:hypothetical protein
MADNGGSIGTDARYVMLSALILGMLPVVFLMDGRSLKP